MCRDKNYLVFEDISEMPFYLFCFLAHISLLVGRDEILSISGNIPVIGKHCDLRVQEIEGK